MAKKVHEYEVTSTLSGLAKGIKIKTLVDNASLGQQSTQKALSEELKRQGVDIPWQKVLCWFKLVK